MLAPLFSKSVSSRPSRRAGRGMHAGRKKVSASSKLGVEALDARKMLAMVMVESDYFTSTPVTPPQSPVVVAAPAGNGSSGVWTVEHYGEYFVDKNGPNFKVGTKVSVKYEFTPRDILNALPTPRDILNALTPPRDLLHALPVLPIFPPLF